MADIGSVSVPPALLQPTAQPSAEEMAKRGHIKETAKKFEASFLGIMLQQRVVGVETAAPFGGGPGEAMFKSFMTDAMAKKMTDRGGIGIADKVGREMLKLQGLT